MPAARSRKPPPSAPSPEPEREQVQDEIPSQEPRHRTAKYQRIQSAVEGIYIMLGGGLTTLPMVAPRTKMMGVSLARSSEEIASAWVDLAEEDARVRAILEQFISFSGWGKVIGVHFMVIGSGVPAVAAMRQAQQQPRQQQQQPPQTGAASDIQQAYQIAEMLRQMQSEARMSEQGNGQPTPQEQQEQQQRQPPVEGVAPQARRTGPSGFRGRAGMPSPADLGVSVADVPENFPASGSESVKG